MKFIHGEVKWGIIGVGDVCEVKSGPAFSKVPNSKLVAVMRRNREKAADYARRHFVPKFYDDAEELIRDNEVNAIYIATPPAFHEEYALRAIDAGKPVYIEKPVALNAASCQRILDHSQKHEIPASVAHYRRELPLFIEVKRQLEKGAIGKVKLIDLKLFQSPVKNTIAHSEESWRVQPEMSGGGLFHDLAPHQLDVLYWLFGSLSEVHGRALYQDQAYDAPDVTSLSGLFEDGRFFQGLWSFNVPASAVADSCTLIGEKGSIMFPFFQAPELTIVDEAGKMTKLDFQNPMHVQQPLIGKVVGYFRGEMENPCSLNEALESMKMMDSANRR